MRSRIFLSERVPNAERRFGSASEYLPVRIVQRDGSIGTALFTIDQVGAGFGRAHANPEDVPRLGWRERLSIAWSALWT